MPQARDDTGGGPEMSDSSRGVPARPAILRLIERFRPMLRWWPLVGFLSGVASFVLVDRQQQLAGWLAGAVMISWLWLLGENVIRGVTARITGYELPPAALSFATQMIHQETFFFVLPFFLVTTTWHSGQTAFTGLLAAAGLISVIDPLYFHRVAARRWLYLLYHALAVFSIALCAFPIMLHLTTGQSYALAVAALLLVTLPTLVQTLPTQAWYHWLLLGVVTGVLGVVLWTGRYWVPPATLWLTHVSVTRSVNEQAREHGRSIRSITNVALQHGGLYAYSAIRAPRGLEEAVYHVWRHEGHVVDRIRLAISGGRKDGYRAWTHKMNFPTDSLGRWSIEVQTATGQMVGMLRFNVVDHLPENAAGKQQSVVTASGGGLPAGPFGSLDPLR